MTSSLNGMWDFHYLPTEQPLTELQKPTLDSSTLKMPVPGWWDECVDFRKIPGVLIAEARKLPNGFPAGKLGWDACRNYTRGIGLYSRRLSMTQKGPLQLAITGFVSECRAWLNGQDLGYAIGPVAPAVFKIPESFRRDGDNELIVAVANNRLLRKSCQTSGYAGLEGGIRDSIQLLHARRIRIGHVHVWPEVNLKTLNFKVELDGSIQKDDLFRWRFIEPESNKVILKNEAPISTNKFKVSCTTTGLKPWSDTNPNCYRLEMEIVQNEEIEDSREQIFGLRRLLGNSMQLLLNGNPIFLRGNCEHHCFPNTVHAPLEAELYQKMISILKVCGFNWLRFHSWMPPEAYLDAADKLGMLVQLELPLLPGNKDLSPIDEWQRMIRTASHHPSVVLFDGGNELSLNETNIPVLSKFADELRKHAPDILFNPQEALRGVDYAGGMAPKMELFGSPVVMEPTPHNPKRLEALHVFSDVYGHFGWSMASYHTIWGNWRDFERNMKIYRRPCLTHEIGIIGTWLDVDLKDRYEKTRTGNDLFAFVDKQLKSLGVRNRAKNWFEVSAATGRVMQKWVFELIRRCPSVAGYDYLSAIDHHWHRAGYGCGLLNEFYEPKGNVQPEWFSRVNGTGVLLLDIGRRRNIYAESKEKWETAISWYGSRSLPPNELKWRLQNDENKILVEGFLKTPTIRMGDVKPLGDVELTMPKVNKPTHLRLELSLVDGEIALENDWDLWVYPKNPPSSQTNVSIHVVERLDEDTIQHLISGGRVWWRGASGLPRRLLRFQPAPAGRPAGWHYGMVINKHPVTDSISHQGFGDWQFYPVMERATSIEIGKAGLPYNPIIEILSSFQDPSLMGSLCEYRVGKGQLVISSLNLDHDDPMAKALEHSIRSYLGGSNLVSASQIDVETLKKASVMQEKNPVPVQTDEGWDPNAELPAILK